MQDIVQKVLHAMEKASLVQIEVSARHVHISHEDWEILFGKGTNMTFKRPLSQPDQFLCEERVALVTQKGRFERVAILGPERSKTQVELSKSDCVTLCIPAPVRESGDIDGSAQVTVEGPAGSIMIPQGVIIAKRHVHIPPRIAELHNFKDKQIVKVEVFSERPLVFKDVMLRVSDSFNYRMHIDFDEANAACISGFTLGRIIV